MRILLAHNYYQLRGGEDASFEAEAALLEAHGHEVLRHAVHNEGIARRSNVALALETVWNRRAAAELGELARRHRPQVAHFHNTFPLLSPASLYAVRGAGAAVVVTVQNYRLLCVNAMLFRQGRVCEACVGKRVPFKGVVHACYRDSRAASAAVATMLAVHAGLRTWDRAVDVFIAPSEFTASRLATLGLARATIRTKVNFLDPDPGPGRGAGGYALFAGRLSPEKGIRTLLDAWRELGTEVPLKVVGDGPSRPEAESARVSGVELLGHRTSGDVLDLVGEASFLVAPSIWYEGLPRVVVEAYARGTPVVASRIGALEETVSHGVTGLTFRPGDAADLVRTVRSALAVPGRFEAMRVAARAAFESTYTGERNLPQLLATYELAMAKRAGRR